MRLRPLLLSFTLLTAFAIPQVSPAVVILDSTWKENGGTRAHPERGFKANADLARQPQFRALVSISGEDGESWGIGSGTWIGNRNGLGYVMTAAHVMEDGKASEFLFKTDAGTIRRGKRMWLHPNYTSTGEDLEGVDIAIVELDGPIEDGGPIPLLYAGNRERGKILTFVGYGTRGIGSRGEQEEFTPGADKTAGQGYIDEAMPMDRSAGKGQNPGNYLGIYLPKEDGSVQPPRPGAPTKPVSRYAGLLGAGDSGGSAWIQLADGTWAIAGLNASGDDDAGYGDSSWFTRVSGLRGWILSRMPDARFVDDSGKILSGDAVASVTNATPPGKKPDRQNNGTANTTSGLSTIPLCRTGDTVFARYEKADWYLATVLGSTSDGCNIRYEADDEEDTLGRDDIAAVQNGGPGKPVSDCKVGTEVLAEDEGVWYPATIRAKRPNGCLVRYDNTDYSDERIPFDRLRTRP
jgi:hypothetical protein